MSHNKSSALFFLALIAILFVTSVSVIIKSSGIGSNSDDLVLRNFLGIKSLKADFTIPDRAAGYYPVIVFFEDGKEVNRVKGKSIIALGSQSKPFYSNIQLLRQIESNKCIKAAVMEGNLNTYDLMPAFSHWDELINGSWKQYSLDQGLQYQDIKLLAVMSSNPVPYDLTGDAVPSVGKYVVAIGIVLLEKSDSTRQP